MGQAETYSDFPAKPGSTRRRKRLNERKRFKGRDRSHGKPRDNDADQYQGMRTRDFAHDMPDREG